MENEASKNEILEAINTFSTHIDEQIGGIKSDVSSLKSDIGWIKSNMVTKDFLEEKMADLRGDLVVLVRKEDTKLLKLVDILKGRKLISAEEATAVLSMEPFAKLSL